MKQNYIERIHLTAVLKNLKLNEFINDFGN